MTKQLEDFIKKNKGQFDTLEPKASLWDKISDELDDGSDDADRQVLPMPPPVQTPEEATGASHRQLARSMVRTRVWQVAAGLFFVLSAVLVFERYNTQPPTLQELLGAEFAEVEGYYMNVIQAKQQKVNGVQVNDPYLLEDLHTELKELNVLYGDLQHDYLLAPNERLVHAMINNLKLRIAILDKQLEIVEKVNTYKDEDDTRTI